MLLNRYKNIFRSRWSALFWAGTVLVSAYFAVPAPEDTPPLAASVDVAHKSPAKPANADEQSLDELIAKARAAEDARQEAMREAARQDAR